MVSDGTEGSKMKGKHMKRVKKKRAEVEVEVGVRGREGNRRGRLMHVVFDLLHG